MTRGWNPDALAALAVKRAGRSPAASPQPPDAPDGSREPPLSSEPQMRPDELFCQLRIVVRRKGARKWEPTSCVLARQFAADELIRWREGRAVGYTAAIVVPAVYEAGACEFGLRREPA